MTAMKITDRPSECDCTANRCEPRIDVSVRREGIRVEVHGMDDNPDNAANVARSVAGLIEAIYEAAEADHR